MTSTPSPVVDVVVVGAMKAGTTALHHLLGAHPGIDPAPGKEVDFFHGDRPGGPGQWWRGVAWYDRRLGGGTGLRLDTSPGYSSPDHPLVAERLAAVAPGARVVYLVRDPLDRAVSQWRHHRRDGTEPRPLEQVLVDPDDHYVRRSRHHERLGPFLDHLPHEQVAVVDHARLRDRPGPVLDALVRWIGLPPVPGSVGDGGRWNAAGSPPPPVPPAVADRFGHLVADDVDALARRWGALVTPGCDDPPAWCRPTATPVGG